MLEFNHYFRPSAKQLLKNKIFDSIRDLSFEIAPLHKIKLNIDTDEKLKVDYDGEKDDNQNKKVLLKLIIKEFKKVRKQN